MGLDMYAISFEKALATPAAEIPDNVDEIFGQHHELHYWRKHPNLHGWMRRLFVEKNGFGEFNCRYVTLTTEDLDRLENDIVNNALPYTSGFFFGVTDGSKRADDLAFVAKARQEIANGRYVLYFAW